MTSPWRLIVDEAEDGAFNMAVDEAILEAYEGDRGGKSPTLRLYSWNPATVSLGKSQEFGGSHDRAAALRQGIGLVRRPSGGTAVLHEFERTYAVVGSLTQPPFTSGIVEAYRAIAGALTLGLRRLGIAAAAGAPRRGSSPRTEAFCFERTGEWEIEASGRKLVGAAQIRRRAAVLQHGSIPIRLDPARLDAVFGRRVDGSRFIDVTTAAGHTIEPDALDRACVSGFEEAFRVKLVPGALAPGEAARAAELRCWKYDSVAWTRDGVIGPRESRWGPALAR